MRYILYLSLLTAIIIASCKKEETEVTEPDSEANSSCILTSEGPANGLGKTIYSYESNGRLVKAEANISGVNFRYEYVGKLIKKTKNEDGIQTPEWTYEIGDKGYVVRSYRKSYGNGYVSFDTTFFQYSSDGYLKRMVKIQNQADSDEIVYNRMIDTIDYKLSGGNIVEMQRRSKFINMITTFEYYTDKPNKYDLPVSSSYFGYDYLPGLFGKKGTNLISKVIFDKYGFNAIHSFAYSFNSAGYPIALTINHSGGGKQSVEWGYTCK